MNKLGLIVGGLIVVILGWMLWEKQATAAHYHAGFVVYQDGVKQDYSGYQYMNYTPCSEHDVKKSAAEEQMEKAHLHDGVGDVVHVHREGAVWGDLFKNIGVGLESNVGGYLDGEWKQNILNQPILPYQTMVLVIGENKPEYQQERISREHIIQVEAASELCGS